MTGQLFIISKILLNIIGLYFIIKLIFSYINHGFSTFDLNILLNRSWYVILFSLCFLGVSIANNDYVFTVLYLIIVVLNYLIYFSYKKRINQKVKKG